MDKSEWWEGYMHTSRNVEGYELFTCVTSTNLYGPETIDVTQKHQMA